MPPAIDLARHYAEAISALRAVHDFDDWIGQFWHDRCPAPASAAASRNALGTDDAIIWHEGEDTVFGYLPGDNGCFCVPRDVALPEFSFALDKAVIPYGQDVLISAAMREELQPPGS